MKLCVGKINVMELYVCMKQMKLIVFNCLIHLSGKISGVIALINLEGQSSKNLTPGVIYTGPAY